MVIRRIREHAATHNWFAVTIDVLILFIGAHRRARELRERLED